MQYNFDKVREILNSKKNIQTAYLGIHEYWGLTAEQICENGIISDKLEDTGKSLDMCNITYGTPVLDIEYRDNTTETVKVGD
jgi:hypothetical protein